jgi:high-affinity Fe2+/Pb2+ permease
MVSILQLRIIGTAGIALGLLILLLGFLTLSKNTLATGFVVIIISVTILYYVWRMSDRQQ